MISEKQIYTLAQSRTNNITFINGEGSEVTDKTLINRAKRKTITQTMMLKLIDIAKEDNNPELEKAFWNTYHCQDKVITKDNKLYGNYCKNRFCTLCRSIRKAELINKYYPIMKNWNEPQLVTITIRAVPEKYLKSRIDAMLRGLTKIIDKNRKKEERGNGIKLIGIKSLESNFNPKRKTYNPHLHIITASKEMAEIIVNDWLKMATTKFAQKQAQNITPIYNLETGLIEVIKYGSKIFTEPHLKKQNGDPTQMQIYAKALYNIFKAMRGKRIFDRFGFEGEKQEVNQTSNTQIVNKFEEWKFDLSKTDWINTTTGEGLSNYNLNPFLQAVLQNGINSEMS